MKLECDGYGKVPSDLMFVGISAGQRGALITKVPLTKDASGRIFQRCLSRLGLSESDEFSTEPVLHCYITNLVKSRVLTKKGLNRLPTQREMIDWLPYFEREVEKVQPKRIIALGSLVAGFLKRNGFHKITVEAKHPRWYQSHGALAIGSPAFEEMVKQYQTYVLLAKKEYV